MKYALFIIKCYVFQQLKHTHLFLCRLFLLFCSEYPVPNYLFPYRFMSNLCRGTPYFLWMVHRIILILSVLVIEV